MGKLDGKVVVITGAASGIGKATARLAATEGAKVAICDINDMAGEKVMNAIREAGSVANYYHVDVANEKEVEETFQRITEDLGMIYGLVNNAAIMGADKPIHQISEQEWDQVFAVNVKGVFFCTKHAIPYMMEVKEGSIVNISSIYGIIGAKDVPPYHASKGAVRIMTKVDAVYYSSVYNIRVNSVHPGTTDTRDEKLDNNGSGMERMRQLHPIGRVAKPEEIAAAILFLLSHESSFMTGAELVVDGGYTAV